MPFSKSWLTTVSGGVDNKSFWAVVTLLIFWLESGSSWAGNTLFTVPEWLVVWALAVVVEPLFSSRAFACVGDGVDGSWGAASTIAALAGGIVLGSGGAFSALLGDAIEELS